MKKIAIASLTRGYGGFAEYNKLIERNNSIYNQIVKNSSYEFDNIIFHEGNITNDHQLYIQNLSKVELQFIDVKSNGNKLAFNNSIIKSESEFCNSTHESNWFPIGYKHMCHFWSIDFFEYLNEYDLIIRIDEDCVVQRFDDDYIQQILDGEKVFLSPHFQGKDEWYVTVGLEKLWNKFMEENSIEINKKYDEVKFPYTNFMCLNLKYFRENEIVQKFLNSVDMSNCIYINRWGDLPIWGLILSSFVPQEMFGVATKIGYYHSSHNAQIN